MAVRVSAVAAVVAVVVAVVAVAVAKPLNLAFTKAHVQARPPVSQAMSYRGVMEDLPQFYRGDVEGIPDSLRAAFRAANPIEKEEDVVIPFSRAAVEAYPLHAQAYAASLSEEESSHNTLAEDVFSDATSSFEFNPRLSVPEAGQQRRTLTESKFICYVESWASKRKTPMNFNSGDMEDSACTHLIYAFAGLDEDSYTIKSLDHDGDIISGGYKSFTRLKQYNPLLKVMISIGGWNEGGRKYSMMVSSEENRKTFIGSVVAFMEEYGFDGLELDWEYPGSSDRGGREGDKEAFSRLVKELYDAFAVHGWVLSAAVAPMRPRIDAGYDVPTLGMYLDFISVTTYDLRGPWDSIVDHHATIESKTTDAYGFESLNTKHALEYWVELGAPRSKLVLGIPFYARTFTLANPEEHVPGSKAISGGDPGPYTKERGMLAYYELCEKLEDPSWNKARDELGSPYMWKGDQWIGYDDPEYIAQKTQLVKKAGYGGAGVWAVDLDDYWGRCAGRWPLLGAVGMGLSLPYELEPAHKVVCYLESWAVKRPQPFTGANPAGVDTDLCTHVVYAFAGLHGENFTIRSIDHDYDVVQGGYKSAASMKREHAGLKMLIGVGGWNEGGRKFSQMVSTEENRKNFIISVVKFLKEYNFDGINLDWEYPGATDRGGRRGDSAGLSKLLEELSTALSPRGWGLSMAVPPASYRVDQGYDVPVIAKYLDFMSVATYDLRGHWDGFADHHAPLDQRSHDSQGYKSLNVKDALQYWVDRGAPKDKLLLGVPFYARTFTLSDVDENVPGSKIIGAGAKGRYTGDSGMLAYYEVCQKLSNANWTQTTDDIGSPYIFNGNQWIGYDDADHIASKMNLVKEEGYGGAAVWAIDLDDSFGVCGTRWPLMTAVANGLSDLFGDSESSDQHTTAPPKGETKSTEKPTTVTAKVDKVTTEKPITVTIKTETTIAEKTTTVSIEAETMSTEKTTTLLDEAETKSTTSFSTTTSNFVTDSPTPSKQISTTTSKKTVSSSEESIEESSEGHSAESAEELLTAKFQVTSIIPTTTTARAEVFSNGIPTRSQGRTCVEGTLKSHPTECTAYLICNHGKFQKMPCGATLHWDAENEMCNKPEKAKCASASGGMIDNTIPESSGTITESKTSTTQWTWTPPTTESKTSTTQWTWTPPTTESAISATQWTWTKSTSTTSSTTPEKPIVTIPSPFGDYKMVCYFTNWSMYRKGAAKYVPSDMDTSLCTHIVYGFAVLEPTSLIIKAHDPWADTDQWNDKTGYDKVVALAKKDRTGVKTLLAIGGWNDSKGDKYSRLVKSKAARAKFIKHVIEYLREHNFDGLDLDWEYPKCWQVDCDKGPASDKANFATFVRELREAFDGTGRNLLLTAAVSPAKKVIDAGYDVPSLSRDLDWIAVMTYDYHGQWDKQTGHNAPMYLHPDDENKHFHADFSMKYWVEKGAAKNKLVLGMPLYGQSFTLTDPKGSTGLNVAAKEGGTAGTFTRAKGMLAYYEICRHVKYDGWTVVQDPEKRMGPYAYKGNQWVSYDDAASLRRKSQYIIDNGYAGGMVWALDLDDFTGTQCGDGTRHPLMHAITDVLKGAGSGHSATQATLSDRKQTTPARATTTSTSTPATTKPTQATTTTDFVNPESAPAANTLPSTTGAGVGAGAAARGSSEGEACQTKTFKSHESSCRAFYQCNNGKLIQRKCAVGTHWDQARKRCRHENEVNCIHPTSPRPNPQGAISLPESSVTAATQAPTTATTHSPTTATTHAPTTATTHAPTTATIGSTTHASTPSLPVPSTSQEDYKVVCYFTNWAIYRPDNGKYTPAEMNVNLCTHIVYGFAVLDQNTLLMKPHDSWIDIDKGFYKDVIKRGRDGGAKVLLAIGGWTDSAGDKYTRLVSSAGNRRKFIKEALKFITTHGFDGLDLDWEYPKCWQVDCDKGPASDKANFVTFVRELREAFDGTGQKLLLTAAVSPSKKVIDAGYDVPALNRYLDWIAVMTYDYHGPWDKKTGHVAPMFHHLESPVPEFNANFTLHYWIEKGAQAKKLVMGMPMYGKAFTLRNRFSNGLFDPASKGAEGEYTREGGFLSFYEICDRIQNKGWTVVKDPAGSIGPYAYKGDQWVSFDDTDMIQYKSEYVRSMGLGGAMIWALDLDDFTNANKCDCGEEYPLLKTINRGLGRLHSAPTHCPK